jgi:hypothetical protein
VIRLHHLAEFGGERSGVPTLAELATYMGTTQGDIRNWCQMCLHAEKRGFDFEKREDDTFLVKECGKVNYFGGSEGQ